jgi:superfamily II DNA/RNA helicase
VNFVVQVIVFLTTARLTQYYAELIGKTGIKVLEIHSRKSQSQVRTHTAPQHKVGVRTSEGCLCERAPL